MTQFYNKTAQGTRDIAAVPVLPHYFYSSSQCSVLLSLLFSEAFFLEIYEYAR